VRWRFEDLSTFLTVVETGGITAAARKLNIAKSIVSKRVSDLEAALGVQLLQRSTRVVRPTADGEAVALSMGPLARAMIEQAEQIASGGGTLSGRMRIAAPMSFGTLHLSPILTSFAAAHPALELAIDLDDRMVDLVHGGYDVGIRIGNLPDSSLIARKLIEEERVVVCSPAYRTVHGLPADVADLAHHACIDYAHVHASQLWHFTPSRPGGRARSIALASRIVANNGEVMRDMALAGLGLATLPMFVIAGHLRDGSLIDALPHARPEGYAIHVVHPPSAQPSAKVRAFVDHVVAAFANGAPWMKKTGPANGRGKR
jgi:DNA-binding transcriptional LysR family regulator